MLTSHDEAEADESGGEITNGGTLRGVLALRRVLLSNLGKRNRLRPNLRVIAQLATPSPFIDAAVFRTPSGVPVVRPRRTSRARHETTATTTS